MTASDARIVHLYYSDLAHESRLLRAARAAVDSGAASTAIGIGYHAEGLTEDQEMAPGIQFMRLRVARWTEGGGKVRRLLRWPLWSWHAARATAKLKPALIQCHSLAAMPAGLLARCMSKDARIVYDAHELESERNGWSPLLKGIARVVERQMIRRSDALIVVGPMIAEWYRDQYNIPLPTVVRNVPDLQAGRPADVPLRQRLGLSPDTLLFVYVGVIGHGRGIPTLLDVFAAAESDRHVAFVGFGPLSQGVVDAAAASTNIHFIPPVPSDEVTSFIRDADVGLSIIEDIALSYRYCLPNKLFEYRHAGLAVLASDLPEMRALLQNYGGGWVTQPDTEAVAAIIGNMTRDDVRSAIAEARPLFGWAQERVTYLDLLGKVQARKRA